jgi:hypothetical protein
MKTYKVRVVKHTKFDDTLIEARNEKQAIKKASKAINPQELEDGGSITMLAEEIVSVQESVLPNVNEISIPPLIRTEEGKVREGEICISCKEIYLDKENTESISKFDKCVRCSELEEKLIPNK